MCETDFIFLIDKEPRSKDGCKAVKQNFMLETFSKPFQTQIYTHSFNISSTHSRTMTHSTPDLYSHKVAFALYEVRLIIIWIFDGEEVDTKLIVYRYHEMP